MYCKYCGEQIANESQFCPKCGKRLNAENKDNKQLEKKKERKKGVAVRFTVVLVIAIVFVIGFSTLSRKKMEKEYKEFVEQAETQYEQQDYKSAIVSYLEAEKILEKLHSNDTAIYLEIGHTYHNLKQYDEAVNYYNKVIEENPEIDEAYIALLDIYIDQGNEKAIKDVMDKAIKEGKNKTTFEKLEDLYFNMARYEAYDNFILEELSRAGGCSISGDFIRSTGMCFKKLFDFDGDGWDDLVICYTKSEHDINNIPYNIDDYVIEVYSYKNENVEKIYTGEPITNGNGTKEIILVEKSGKLVFASEETENAEIYVLQGYVPTYENINKKIAYNTNEETDAKLAYNNKIYETLLSYNTGTYFNTYQCAGNICGGNYAYESDDLRMYLCSYIDYDGESKLYVTYYYRKDNYFGSEASYSFQYDLEKDEYILLGDYSGDPVELTISQDDSGVHLSMYLYMDNETMQATLKKEELYDVLNFVGEK